MTLPNAEIVVAPEPNAAQREAILRPLVAYNEKSFGPSNYKTIALLVRDPATGETIGGLWAKMSFDWVFVELLVVPETMRGQGLGSRLLDQLEQIARQHECGGIWLDTFGFQARDFYVKNGFDQFGQIDGHPRGNKRHFMCKRL